VLLGGSFRFIGAVICKWRAPDTGEAGKFNAVFFTINRLVVNLTKGLGEYIQRRIDAVCSI
jgi:hypothetical protein